MDSTKVRMNLPDKFYSNYKNISYIPDYYRVIEIVNDGSSPSKNLRLQILTDGDVYDHKVESTEKINEFKTLKGEIITEIQRLSPNAKIIIELWLNDGENTFQINYADDNNSGVLKKKEDKFMKTILDYITIIISLFSFGGFIYSKYYLQSKEKLIEVNFENQELENQINIIVEQLKEEMSNSNDDDVEFEEVAEYKRRLEDFMRNSSSFSKYNAKE